MPAHLFLVALDDERTSFRYHRLVRQVLRAELRARDRAREQALQLRAAEWFEATGDTRRAAHHYLAAQQADRALALLQDRVVPDFLHVPAAAAAAGAGHGRSRRCWRTPRNACWAWPPTCCCRVIRPAAASTLTCLSRPGRSRPDSRLAARFAAFQSFRYGVTGQLEKSVQDGAGRAGHPGAGRSSPTNGTPSSRWSSSASITASATSRRPSARQPRLWPHPTSPTRSSS